MLGDGQLSGESSVRAIKEFFNPPYLVPKARQLIQVDLMSQVGKLVRLLCQQQIQKASDPLVLFDVLRRSTMSQQCLNHFKLLHIHYEAYTGVKLFSDRARRRTRFLSGFLLSSFLRPGC